MIHSGNPAEEYVDTAVRHVLLRQGVLGIKVKIMLPHDPSGKTGPKTPLPDHVSIVEPKEEILPEQAYSEQDWTQDASSRPRFHRRAQGRDPSGASVFGAEGSQGSGAHRSSASSARHVNRIEFESSGVDCPRDVFQSRRGAVTVIKKETLPSFSIAFTI